MASETCQLVMRPVQGKLGLLIMVKFPEFPALGVVAGITFWSQPPFMDIVPHVAVHAFRRSFLILC